ncbi:fibronectin type III domain-containing protein [Marinobacter salicampi]|uniref:fibronectin type III domain-containing protein n=1 Tax=Marinobacter salicampi TaxID=435907 RepID=UPI001408A663|nr:fibronectin type III domain-containing protein [Marinobacter salicampi]
MKSRIPPHCWLTRRRYRLVVALVAVASMSSVTIAKERSTSPEYLARTTSTPQYTSDKAPSTTSAKERSTSTSSYSKERSSYTRRPSLSWNAPMTRENGSKLYVGEIEGYRLYYRLRNRSNYRSVTLDGYDATSFKLNGLTPGIYEFTITTLDTEGLESRRSKPLSVNVN